MRTLPVIVLGISLLMGGFGCKRDAADRGEEEIVVAAPEAAATPGSPKDTILKWARAIEAGSADELLRFYADNEDLTVIFSYGLELRGFAAVKELYTKQLRETVVSNSKVTDLTVKQEQDTAAVTCRHRVDLSFLVEDMEWQVDVHTAFDLKKHEDSWQIIREKSSPIAGVPRLRPKHLRWSLDFSSGEGFGGKIEAVGRDDTLKVNAPGIYKGTGPVERYYLGTARPNKLFRVQVTEDRQKKTATIRVAAAAADQLQPGEEIRADRTLTWIDAELKSLPDFLLVQDATKPPEGMSKEDAAHLKESLVNLKQIGLALHNWADVYHGRFPPAVIYGPDGKPWHSWRVLILPFLEQDQLYRQYKFDEPWDGPNNIKLLEIVVPQYRDPIHGSKDRFTHYAAVTGPGTAFPAEGVKTDNPKRWVEMHGAAGAVGGAGKAAASPKAQAAKAGQTRIPTDFKDGLSNTLLLGSVSPQRKIRWTKPEDVTFKEAFPLPGQPGSFAAPYRAAGRSAGVFLWADGSARTIGVDIDPETWRSLWLIADGKAVGRIPKLLPELEPPAGMQEEPVIRISWDKGTASARYVVETVPRFVSTQDLDKLPVGIKVVHQPQTARAGVTGKSQQPSARLWYKTSVSATGGPVRIVAFGKYTSSADHPPAQWVHMGRRPHSAKLFARWYSCPDALLKPGTDYVDPMTWSAERELREGKTRSYFIGIDEQGRRVKGEAVVDQKGQIEPKKTKVPD